MPTTAPPSPTLRPGPGQTAKRGLYSFWSYGCQVPGSVPLGFPGSLGFVPTGLRVSPQLFSCLHHYQVPRVVDLPVQLVIMLLEVVSSSR